MPRFLCGRKAAPPRRQAPAAWAAAGILLCGTIAIGIAASSAAARRPAAVPVGLWYAEGGAAQIELRDCGDALCGRVVELRSPFDEHGCALRDRYNPDDSLRQRPVIGLEILRGLRPSPDAEGVWSNGTIYDPGSGSTYRASLTVASENRLALRGYVGIPLLGRDTTWFRVGTEQTICAETSASRTEPP
jgi:uncharacterized protein (DUF2147 family)